MSTKGKPATEAGHTQDVGSDTPPGSHNSTEPTPSQASGVQTWEQAAIEYLGLGWSFYPSVTKKIPACKWGPYRKRQPTGREVKLWANNPKVKGITIITGPVSGLVTIDIDSPEAQAEAERRGLPQTPTVKTHQGKHYYFKYPSNGQHIGKKDGLLPQMDIKGEGGCCMAPPSIHDESGEPYEWLASPWDCDLADLPRWIVDLWNEHVSPKQETTRATTPPPPRVGTHPYAQKAFDDELSILAMTGKGQRNDQLNRGAYSLFGLVKGGHLQEQEVRAALTNTAQSIGLGIKGINPTLNSAWAAAQPREIPQDAPTRAVDRAVSNVEQRPQKEGTEGAQRNLTEMGNTERLLDAHKPRILYCDTWGKWLIWDGIRWEIDETRAIYRLAANTVKAIYTEASNATDEAQRKSIARWALKSESERIRNAMVSDARKDVPIEPDHLDRDPMLLNCQNGTVDLRTGELNQQKQSDHITKLAPVEYDPGADCQTWLTFLDRIMDGNAEMIDFLQRAIGYSLTGDTSEQCLFIPHGGGDNGKSTLLTIVGDMLGDYARQASADTLMVKRYQGIPEDIARLKGARFVSSGENDKRRRLAEGLIKQLTGGDRMTARFLRANSFEFMPEFKLWLATNHKPDIKGTDHAIWRRIRLIPFSVSIPKSEQDKDLPNKLRAELPGILSWAVRGCLAWQRDGLIPPPEVMAATQEYRTEMDMLGQFIDDACVLGDTLQSRAGELYAVYSEWCDENGERKETGKEFGISLKERGFDKYRDSKGYIYVGIGLATIDSV